MTEIGGRAFVTPHTPEFRRLLSIDGNGNRTNRRKRDWRNIVYAYDALNRLTAKTYAQGGATQVHYGYDLRGLSCSRDTPARAARG